MTKGFIVVTCPPEERYWSGTDWVQPITGAKIYQTKTQALRQMYNFKKYVDSDKFYRVASVETGKTIYRL